MKKKKSAVSKAKEKFEHEAMAGRKEVRSKKHEKAEARGMKKAMRGC